MSCEAVERFALGPNFYKQVLVVAAAGNDNSEVPCTRYYGVWVSALTQVLTLYPYLYPYPYPIALPLALPLALLLLLSPNRVRMNIPSSGPA